MIKLTDIITTDDISHMYQVCDLDQNILCRVDLKRKQIYPNFDKLDETVFVFSKHNIGPIIIKCKDNCDLFESNIVEYINMSKLSSHLQSEIKKELILKNLLK